VQIVKVKLAGAVILPRLEKLGIQLYSLDDNVIRREKLVLRPVTEVGIQI
jgi:hypothetical protein